MHLFSVSEFLAYVNDALATLTPSDAIAIEGEVSGFNIAQQQWVRFDLKDADAVMNCFLTVWQLKVPLEDGMKIRVRGYPKVYPKYGKFSFVVSEIALAGEGSLKRAYELLKKKLAAEGLFAPERKRALPRFPSRIGLITSAGAAAYTDFIRILSNRWTGVEVDLYHVAVQGAAAIPDIALAFSYFNEHAFEYDVVVLVRGGGSLEDLQAFNSEDVARAVFGSVVPVVVGVGHERDETLADFVADVRASTPSNAAERVVPDRREIMASIEFSVTHMTGKLEHWVVGHRHEVTQAVSVLEHYFSEFWYRVGEFGRRLAAGAGRVQAIVRLHRERILTFTRVLANVDPKRLLSRGYSVVFDAQGAVVKAARQVDAGADVRVQLGSGAFDASIKKTYD